MKKTILFLLAFPPSFLFASDFSSVGMEIHEWSGFSSHKLQGELV